jgi:ssDNA-binding Zn-finger/Zn-ribbon topoisomerase 1
MGKKRIQKIPSRVNVKCPKCGKNNRLEVPRDRLVNFLQCKHCKEITTTPFASCCIVCAFSKYKCPTNLLIEAKAKNLEVRMPNDLAGKSRILTRKDFWENNQ